MFCKGIIISNLLDVCIRKLLISSEGMGSPILLAMSECRLVMILRFVLPTRSFALIDPDT